MKTREEVEKIALEIHPEPTRTGQRVHCSLKFFRRKLREAFTEGYLLSQEQEHPNRCGRCTPDGTLRSGDMEIICPYCNGSGEERTPKPKQ